MEVQAPGRSDIRDALRSAGEDDRHAGRRLCGDGTLDALGAAFARRLRRRRRPVRHPAGGARRGPAPKRRRRRSWTRLSTAMRSAGWRWARGRRRCSPASLSFAASCPRRAALPDGVASPTTSSAPSELGIDMFDCVLRPGRSDRPSLHQGRPDNIRNAKYAEEASRSIPSRRSRHVERLFHHLVRSNEILGAMLMTEHNLVLPAADAGAARRDREGRLAAYAARVPRSRYLRA